MMKFLCFILSFFFCFTVGQSFHHPNLRIIREKRQSNSSPQPKRIICYYAFWAAKRPGEFHFEPSNIDPTLCTHIMYAYARLEPNIGIVPYDVKEDIENGGWKSAVDLKKINPNAKIILSVGGLFEGSTRFSKMASDTKQRNIFVQSASRVLREFGFDGVDITWLYPGFSEGSSGADKKNYATLIKDLREELTNNYTLSVSVPALKQYIDNGFDLDELKKYVDYMNVLAYSYHDSTDATVNHHGPLYSLPNDPENKDANVDATIREYLMRGVRSDLLNLVIPLYGVAFVLDDPASNEIGASTEDEGIGLEEPGALIYLELCQKIRKESWTVRRVNSTAMGPYAYKDRQWVAYDDEDMIRNKAKYALEKNLGGLAFWTVDQDDFKGACHLNTFPLLRAGREVFLNSSIVIPTTATSTPSAAITTSTTTTSQGNSLNVNDKSSREFSTISPSTQRSPNVNKSLNKAPLSPSALSFSVPNRVKNMEYDDEDVIFDSGHQFRNAVFKSSRDIIFSRFEVFVQNNYHS